MARENVQYELSLRDLLSDKIKTADDATQKFESHMGGLQSAIKKVGIAIGGAFVLNKIVDFGRRVVEAGSKVEDATTGLTTLLGDTAKATEVVKNTMVDATKTPFQFEGLLSANQQLIAAGVNADAARNDVMNLANAVAASGKGNVEFERMATNLAQIKTVGKATAMDIKQFGIAGINIYKVLAEATGKPISAVKEMDVSYEMLTGALQKAHEQGGIFYNGLENMSKNTSVKISNLGDTIFVSMVDIFQKMKPLTDFVLGGIADLLGKVSEEIGNLDLQGFANGMIDAFKGLYDYLQPLFAPIQRFFQAAWDGVQKVWNALKQFSSEGSSIMNGLRDALGYIIDLLSGWFSSFQSFLAGVIDVAHTIYVILEKLKIISFVKDLFITVWNVVQWIGDKLEWIYEHTIAPILDGISWAYKQLKGILGISESVATPTKTAAEKSATQMAMSASATGATKGAGIPEVGGAGKETKGVTGQKVTTINVTIDKLIENFKISTTTIQEGSSKVRELVAQTLLNAVNDSQIVAGQ